MKNRKTYLLRGLLVLLAAALVLAAALPGLGLSTGGPTPLPQAQADPLRPEGQSQSPQTPPYENEFDAFVAHQCVDQGVYGTTEFQVTAQTDGKIIQIAVEAADGL